MRRAARSNAHGARFFAAALNVYLKPVARQGILNVFAPFHYYRAAAGHVFIKAYGVKLVRIAKPVRIEMEKRYAPRVFAHYRERWAQYAAYAKGCGNAPRKRCFARAKAAVQRYERAGEQPFAKLFAYACGVLLAKPLQLKLLHINQTFLLQCIRCGSP